jgi:hypothetical protein
MMEAAHDINRRNFRVFWGVQPVVAELPAGVDSVPRENAVGFQQGGTFDVV